MAVGYPSRYDDHLVPLRVGGADTAAYRWPQPRAEARAKDELEAEVCRGAVSALGHRGPQQRRFERRHVAGSPGGRKRGTGRQGRRFPSASPSVSISDQRPGDEVTVASDDRAPRADKI
jgi:hypothetical protein